VSKPGRNDPCTCGSGKKYKKCCLAKDTETVVDFIWQKMRRTEGELVHVLLEYAHKRYGPEAIAEAWDEFTLWNDVPMDPELDTAFLPWLVFNWVPENVEVDEAETDTPQRGTEKMPEIQVALNYLAEQGTRLNPFQRRFIEEICSQPYSFFVIKDVEPGKRMTLKDLLLKREVCVHERQASTTLRKGAIIFTRVITMDDSSIMVGCAPLVIPLSYLNDFIDFREHMAKKHPHFDQALLLAFDIEIRTLYYDIKEALYNPPLPQLRNTDDDPLQLTKLYYRLSCTPREALDALATLSLANSAEDLLSEAKIDDEGQLISIEFPWLKKGNQQHAGWENTVMGNMIIDGDQLTLEVNSQARADAGKRKITRRLGKRAVFRNAVIQSSEKMMEEIANNPGDHNQDALQQENEAFQALPEVQEKMKAMAAQHWKGWLDSSIPALKDQTPREAAQTAHGRERLDALLLEFEQRAESAPQAFSPDVDALRHELGLD